MKSTIQVRDTYRGGTEVLIHHNQILNQEAEFARRFLEVWGMVAAVDAPSEDSSGRHHFRLQEPAELIERAFTVARLFFERAEKDELLIDVPTPKMPTVKESKSE